MKSFKLSVYLIMGSSNCATPLKTLEMALKAGITCFQLREKGPNKFIGEEYKSFAIACKRLCKEYEVPFIINDDIHLAMEIEADGVHLGQSDISLKTARVLLKDKIIGLSVHNEKEMQEAVKNGADYVGVGAIYKTNSKDDASVIGLGFLKNLRKAYPRFPIVGIGGINEMNSIQVIQAGADGVAVISAICMSSNIEKSVHQLNPYKL